MKNNFSLLILLFGITAWASNQEVVLKIQESVESRITPLVRTVDTDALVYVQVSPETEEAELPSTPLIINGIPISSPSGEIKIKKIEVTILSKVEALPPDITNLIKDMVKSYGVNPGIHMKLFSKAMFAPKENETAQAQKETPSLVKTHLFPLIAVGLGGIIGILGLLVLFGLKKGSKKLSGTLVTGFDRLAAALESGSIGQRSGGESESRHIVEVATQGASPSSHDTLTELPEESLLALLTDCYWGEFDTYAAHLWKSMGVAKKKSLMSRWNLMEEYAAYVSDLVSLDLKHAEEPYYLSPLNLQGVDNKKLAELVLATPGLYPRLPSLRKLGLALKAKDRLELLNQAPSKSAIPEVNASASPKRTLTKVVAIPIASVEEEKEILSLKTLTDRDVARIPSLSWLLKIPKEPLIQCLNQCSAKELASAWIGPEPVLETLKGHLPAKKYSLLKSFLDHKTVIPSRESATFKKLHLMAIDILKKERGGDVGRLKKAA